VLIPRGINAATPVLQGPRLLAVQAKRGRARLRSAHAQPLWVDFLTLMTDVPG
jgi:hypothetical protein